MAVLLLGEGSSDFWSVDNSRSSKTGVESCIGSGVESLKMRSVGAWRCRLGEMQDQTWFVPNLGSDWGQQLLGCMWICLVQSLLAQWRVVESPYMTPECGGVACRNQSHDRTFMCGSCNGTDAARDGRESMWQGGKPRHQQRLPYKSGLLGTDAQSNFWLWLLPLSLTLFPCFCQNTVLLYCVLKSKFQWK